MFYATSATISSEMLMTPIISHAAGRYKALKPWSGCYINFRNSSRVTSISKQDFVRCYRTLKVPANSSYSDVRNAFITLAKKFHPDGGSPDADAEKFQEVEHAYRTLQAKYANEEKIGTVEGTEEKNGVEEYDIRHTAPQHRQYLTFDGYGEGTPAQRQKQYQKMRAVRATDNVMTHRINRINTTSCNTVEEALAIKDKAEARKIKTRYGMDRLVEDLIQESMAKGDFDNLSGRGKPLKRDNTNPYVDFVTHKLNEVLIDNGFTPEWITLQKEIREEKENLRHVLYERRTSLGPIPLSDEDRCLWEEILKEIEPVARDINNKINKYNLVVPMLHNQMLQVQLSRIADRVLLEGKSNMDVPQKQRKTQYKSDGGILDIFTAMFKTK